MLTYNIEGYKRNKFYLASLVKEFNPLFLFLQEHWLPYSEVDDKFHSDFSSYKFLSTASDMFTPVEDLMLTGGTAWQGTTIGWSSDIDKQVLAKGLRFSLSFYKQNFIKHFSAFEVFFKKLVKYDFYDAHNKGFDFFRCSLKHLALNSFYSNKPITPNISKEEENALKNLSNDKSIVIMKPDKGNGVVLMNKDEYISKVKEVLNDTSKFQPIREDLLLKILNKEEQIN